MHHRVGRKKHRNYRTFEYHPHTTHLTHLSMVVRKYHFFLLGDLGARMSKDRKVNGALIHFQGGKLYGMTITCHMLYDMLIFPNELNPSEESANLTFQASEAKQGYCSSKCFQPSTSAGCRSMPSGSYLLSLCHFIYSTICFKRSNLCNLAFSEKYLSTLCGIFFSLSIS